VTCSGVGENHWHNPWQNGTNPSLKGKFRDEYLSMKYFHNRMEARVVIEQWLPTLTLHGSAAALGAELADLGAVRSTLVRQLPRAALLK